MLAEFLDAEMRIFGININHSKLGGIRLASLILILVGAIDGLANPVLAAVEPSGQFPDTDATS